MFYTFCLQWKYKIKKNPFGFKIFEIKNKERTKKRQIKIHTRTYRFYYKSRAYLFTFATAFVKRERESRFKKKNFFFIIFLF